MAEPRSPFDDPDTGDEADSPAAEVGDGRLPRKYSLMILGVMLFVLVWVRELSGMSSEGVFASAIGVLLIWLVIHIRWSVELPDHSAARSGGELEEAVWSGATAYTSSADPEAIEHARQQQLRNRADLARHGRKMLCLGALLGAWMAYFVPLGLIGICLLIAATYGFISLLAAMIPRR